MKRPHKKADIECNQILDFWRQGYTDIQIRQKLNISPCVFLKRLDRIKKDECIKTESMMLFEKTIVRLLDVYKKTIVRLEQAEERQIPLLLKILESVSNSIVDNAQKLGIIDPQRFVHEFHVKDVKEVEHKTTLELIEDYTKIVNHE